MPPPAKQSPVTGQDVPAYYIHADSDHFRDTQGRSLLLRGINLSSSAKTPIGQPGQRLKGFWEAAESGEMSFVGRVLDLENGEADLHLRRLTEWGFKLVRFVFTWEAIEHSGPGKYDQAYLSYVVKLLRRCKAHGIKVIMDPHQDLFSRFSGGSGAPYWALLACGMNPRHFTVTNAAVIQCEYPHPDRPDPRTFPDMIWASNYTRLACQTINTMFWAGKDFAPKCIIDGVNIQDWLQTKYCDAVRQLAKAIKDAGDLYDECVIGWDSVNEPNKGFLEIEDLAVHSKENLLRIGPMPTGFQGLRAGMGETLEVESWRFSSLGPKRDGNHLIDPEGKIAWLDADAEAGGSVWGWKRDPGWKLGACPWALHGVWDTETKELLQPDYFFFHPHDDPARKVDFATDYWKDHYKTYASIIRTYHPEAILCVHTPVFAIPPDMSDFADLVKGRAAFSSHFYDGLTLVTKHWNWFNADALGVLRGKYAGILFALKFGEKAIRKCIRDQLSQLRQDGHDKLGNYPTFMGELGIPYDLDGGRAYETGDYTNQSRALDASLNACDSINQLNYAIWCYCPDNSHRWGDLWNGEDLSVWSPDDLHDREPRNTDEYARHGAMSASIASNPDSTSASSSTDSMTKDDDVDITVVDDIGARPVRRMDLNDGSRALLAFCRPYAIAVVGRPTDSVFDIKSATFTLDVEVKAGDVTESGLFTEIFVPMVHFGASPKMFVPDVRDDDLGFNDPIDSKKTNRRERREPDDMKPTALDLDVTVSAGDYSIDGQVLSWRYPIPRPTTNVPLKHSITIKRASGPIPTWQREYGSKTAATHAASASALCGSDAEQSSCTVS
ncbi:glycoside hydrolase family 5 protein [Mixia osmundae IAM 14324]|uniref:Glycoside hydrolase family 5 domain-containing protein n=1 Tax=Mixia osmundae (strain CBS 9802 / IAM 14324 / JCM 22182 / KY 12970) TaxID=764103 RepID=G7EAN4_MIXOS|nr:glycoside hydrolase family 5 protein [Mixia osmundae IAM 14324]KEI40864.1 glycoside hydrolase family 5 protein [Mixia osmundae IAM 14324]GAA99894.1 hypothetical protein E5Q_06597 [Mixia osmundae IAM 14324]